MNKSALMATAIGGLLALNLATTVSAAEPAASTEKCYGIAKAGKNDCAGAAHACSGQSKADGSKGDFVQLPKGTCVRLVGGSLTAAK